MPSASSFELLGAHLRVASLSRAEAFYVGVLGLEAAPGTTAAGTAVLRVPGAPTPLLTLAEHPGIPPAPDDQPGLFHLALLVPDRPGLARVLRRLAETKWPIQGLSDHGVSEAIYLADPDQNGLEIYADRPRDQWPQQGGRLTMYTRRLDLAGLLATDPAARAAGLPPGTRLGHVHVRVADLAEAERFFAGDLGLAIMVRDFPGALFLAADGYHHHIGANVWGVRPQAPAGLTAGLESVQVRVPRLTAPRTFQNGAGIKFELTPA